MFVGLNAMATVNEELLFRDGLNASSIVNTLKISSLIYGSAPLSNLTSAKPRTLVKLHLAALGLHERSEKTNLYQGPKSPSATSVTANLSEQFKENLLGLGRLARKDSPNTLFSGPGRAKPKRAGPGLTSNIIQWKNCISSMWLESLV